MNRMAEGKQSKTIHPARSKATEPSQLQPDTPREAPAHRSVSRTRAHKRLSAGQGRQEEKRQETQQGRTGNTETPKTAQETRRAQRTERGASPRSQGKQENADPTGNHTQRHTNNKDKREEDSIDTAEGDNKRQTTVRRGAERIDMRRGVQHMQILNAKRIRECECSCHVYGQTHKHQN